MAAYTSRTPLREALVAQRLSRDRPGWQRLHVSSYELNAMRDDEGWVSSFRQVYLGSESITVTDERTKYVSLTTWPATNGELAREYLALCMTKRKVARRPDWYRRKAPLFCDPYRGNLAYVDLRHAYFEVVRRFPPETCIVAPGTKDQRIVLPASDSAWLNTDDLDEDRTLRHAVVGVLFSQGLQFYAYGKPVEVKLWRGFHRPSLYRITMDMLHAIALDVKRHFHLYAWLTDAAIVRESEAQGLQEFLMERWGFASKVEGHGIGTVSSVSSYQMGEIHDPEGKWSEDRRNGVASRRHLPLSRIARVNVTWWRKVRQRSLRRAA